MVEKIRQGWVSGAKFCEINGRNNELIKGTRQKKKCGKFHIWGGGSGPGHFPHFKKKKVVFKMHFKPF